jgi:hypothetical protein
MAILIRIRTVLLEWAEAEKGPGIAQPLLALFGCNLYDAAVV